MSRWLKILLGFLGVLAVLAVVIAAWLYSLRFGPHHDYELDVLAPEPGTAEAPGQLEVGVAMREISPDFDLYDSWTDVNGNNKYDEGIDTYQDRNKNGKFDGIWMAGFGTNRPAQGLNDAPSTRAIAFRNNGITMVMVTIDSVGIFHNEYVTIRESIDKALGVDHVMFSATHVHETPDTMKIWSYWKRVNWGDDQLDIPIFGFRQDYMDMIIKKSKEAIEEAVSKLQPADMYCAEVKVNSDGFVDDSRQPEVINERMALFRFTKPGTDQTIATFVNWGNHPETLGGSNPIITADFPHYLRAGLENGVPEPNGVEGFGGMCLYFQGQVGGLMTQLHVTVPDRNGVDLYKEDSFKKAEALGYNLAVVAATALRDESLVWKNENPKLAYFARTVKAPMSGQYEYAIKLGLIHEGYYAGGKAKTEMNVLRVGDVLILTVPGEIYPEIVEGGIVALPGNDFNLTEPVEVPPLRTFMEEKARMAFVVGLANDQIGYIIPRSQWDNEPPYVYNNKSQYGEENSAGPDIAPMVHQIAKEMLTEMNQTF
ncbi:MAG: hypothetical protein GC168_16225 [Candidatus Hydrogenedens sp.]|nr:hypothetical protein [Candidatus Hydrogenedens sp.]